MKISTWAFLGTVLFVLSSRGAWAADTVETWEKGAAELELFAAFDHMGMPKYERHFSAEALVGYGLAERFSGYVTLGGQSNEYLADAGVALGLGLFGTPLDTEHVDLDLFLHIGLEQSVLSLTPSLELNLDLAPDLAKAGIYGRLEERLSGRDDSVADDPSTPDDEARTRFSIEPMTCFAAGLYWTPQQGHQLLAQYDLGLAHNHPLGERRLEIGGLAVGYNVMLNETLELVTQVSVDIPQGGESVSFGVMLGLVAAVPPPAMPPPAI